MDRFDETDQDEVRLIVHGHGDGNPTFTITNADGTESDAFEISTEGRAELAAMLDGGLSEEPFYTLEIAFGGVSGRTSGPDAAGVGLVAERAIRAIVQAQRPHGEHLTRELTRVQDELGRYRLQDHASGKRIAELEAGVKLLEEQATVLAQVREALRAAGRNEADPVASIRGLRYEAQGVDGKVINATRERDRQINVLEGQLGYQRSQVDAAQAALRTAVAESTEADRLAAVQYKQIVAQLNEERKRATDLGHELAEERRIGAEQCDEIRTRTERTLVLERQLHEVTELNATLSGERDKLRDALGNTLSELCDMDTGESRETHFSSESAALVVADGRRALREVYGD